MRQVVTLLPALALLVGGCGSLAFYEDSKIAISIAVDPSAPDPVELTAAYKETVYALIPTKEDDDGTVHTGEVLADFDVRYGVNAGARADVNRDFLYAVVTQGLATGPAAVTLATRGLGSVLQARRAVIVHFLAGLDAAGLQDAAAALGLSGVGAPDEATLRRRLAAEVRQAPGETVKQIEDTLEQKFPAFKRYAPKS